jgi:hypothetical protein
LGAVFDEQERQQQNRKSGVNTLSVFFSPIL